MVLHFREKVRVLELRLKDSDTVICKHMVALDLGIFPEKKQQMMDELYY